MTTNKISRFAKFFVGGRHLPLRTNLRWGVEGNGLYVVQQYFNCVLG